MPVAQETFLQTFQNLVLGLNAGVQTLNTSLSLAVQGYATGSWTPILQFGGSGIGIVYATQLGSYTKIGREVICRFRIVLSVLPIAAPGAATIAGLPFPVNTDQTDTGSGGIVVQAVNMAGLSGTLLVAATPSGASANLSFPTATETQNLTIANFTAVSEIDGYLSYFV